MVYRVFIILKLIGVLSFFTGVDSLKIEVDEEWTIADLLRSLCDKYEGDFKEIVCSNRGEVLILINDMEVGVLDGQRSKLNEGDVVVLLPVSHGG